MKGTVMRFSEHDRTGLIASGRDQYVFRLEDLNTGTGSMRLFPRPPERVVFEPEETRDPLRRPRATNVRRLRDLLADDPDPAPLSPKAEALRQQRIATLQTAAAERAAKRLERRRAAEAAETMKRALEADAWHQEQRDERRRTIGQASAEKRRRNLLDAGQCQLKPA